MRQITITWLFVLWANGIMAQFPPPVGYEGTTAIYADSSVFSSWAVTCTVHRGYIDISNPDLGLVSHGSDSCAIGKANSNVISLGDGGYAILSFNPPITNGPGFDFAVFENALDDTFLELAFVEVSSDGINYERFPAVSLTDASSQTPTFGTINVELIHNLAGKYRLMYGTPFDLDELPYNEKVDINKISHVKIIDVVGSINPDYANYDSQANIINDPWPTPFNTGGFDLDAVGVINSLASISNISSFCNIIIYPNPANNSINISSDSKINSVKIFDVYGIELINSKSSIVNTEFLVCGLYYVHIFIDNKVYVNKLIISR